MIELAAARGKLVRIAEGLWLHAERWSELCRRVAGAIRERGGLTVADIRDLVGSSRKFMVPICEALDRAEITRRTGDLRTLGAKAPMQA